MQHTTTIIDDGKLKIIFYLHQCYIQLCLKLLTANINILVITKYVQNSIK